MNKEAMLKNRAFSAVYQLTKGTPEFRKGTLFGKVNQQVWTPVRNPLNAMATGKLLPYTKEFESSDYVKLRDKVQGNGPAKWWTDGKGKQQPFTFSNSKSS